MGLKPQPCNYVVVVVAVAVAVAAAAAVGVVVVVVVVFFPRKQSALKSIGQSLFLL